MSRPPASEPALKVAEDLRGVKKGSRGVPLLILAGCVVAFIAYAITVPRETVSLITVPDVAAIPTSGTSLWVIARVGPDRTWHFRVFDRGGHQVATVKQEEAGALPCLLEKSWLRLLVASRVKHSNRRAMSAAKPAQFLGNQ